MYDSGRLLLYTATALLAGCGDRSPSPPAEGTVAAVSEAPVPSHLTDTDLGVAIRAAAGTDIGDARYFDAAFDLDGDGAAERIVYLAGPMVCGTGGCGVFVFTPRPDGYHLVTAIAVVRPPIRIAPRSTYGWHDLVVRIGGGGGAAGDVELKFDGATYPSNPTTPPVEPVASLDGTEILIPEFGSYTEGEPVITPAGANAGG